MIAIDIHWGRRREEGGIESSMAEAAKVDAIIEKLKSAADSAPRRHVGPFGRPTDRRQPYSHDTFESLRTP
jgi:hypothetical protein